MVRKVRITPGTVRKLIALGYLERSGDEKAEGMAIEAYLGDTLAASLGLLHRNDRNAPAPASSRADASGFRGKRSDSNYFNPPSCPREKRPSSMRWLGGMIAHTAGRSTRTDSDSRRGIGAFCLPTDA
jgi:hypothetical protein